MRPKSTPIPIRPLAQTGRGLHSMNRPIHSRRYDLFKTRGTKVRRFHTRFAFAEIGYGITRAKISHHTAAC